MGVETFLFGILGSVIFGLEVGNEEWLCAGLWYSSRSESTVIRRDQYG